MITVLDYGSGNIAAIANLLRLSNLPHAVVQTPDGLSEANHIILPGVGAFDNTMASFRRSGVEAALHERTQAGAALLGICVGMQVLAEASDEGTEPGLNLVPGRVRRFDPQTIDCPSKVPHMGWNAIKPTGPHPLLEGIDLERGFYFLHSYYFDCADAGHALAVTEHGRPFHCAVGNGRVFGVQFHPEKSHDNGVRLFQNFMSL
ncbi:imidazole glycerol phosphate synthase subunit HisH [Nitratireductor mangrovi]|uniref:Imidazole glycerol phosphate synthase subunit HisH n=1 Tax=Nitratireductor mangrovi TaxID=2599600 RepID=A0A5B8KXH4_9HYPH|nr:imidazole glycerol phosphate synthase subunit HisH [Nitratireductor mangrovi]QDZ00206.1 imidazole glycerol phosphate synthase subunit HisH [Nitratireductor mangrovi]